MHASVQVLFKEGNVRKESLSAVSPKRENCKIAKMTDKTRNNDLIHIFVK